MPKKYLINDPVYLAIVLNDIHNREDNVPKGFYTTKQWREKWSNYSHPERIIKLGLESGMIISKNFRIRNKSNKVLPVPHYKFIGKEPKNPRKK